MPRGCPSEISITQFMEPINERLTRERIPLSGSIELTYRCNLRCAHCYCNLPSGDTESQKRELTAYELFGFLDRIAERGCLWLLFTGGEPLLRKDFREIYLYAKKRGFLISVFTNATLITPEIADLFMEWTPFELEVTMYGASEKVYEAVTGVKGSFSRFIRGLDLCSERGLEVGLKTMASSINKDEIFRMKQFARNRKMRFRFDPLLHSRIDGSDLPRKFRISADEVVRLDIQDDERREAWKKAVELNRHFKREEYVYICGAGGSIFCMDPYGKMSVCSMVLEPSYSIKENSFDTIWDKLFPEVLKRRYNPGFKCASCEYDPYCSSCPGWGISEGGSPEAVPEYHCGIAKARKEAFEKLESAVVA